MYDYSAQLVRVVDGDTVYMRVSLGFNIEAVLDFRLLGINAPEVVGITKTAGLASKSALDQFLSQGSLHIWTSKSDKYGRWLVKIQVTRPDNSTLDVNQAMLDGGFAVPYNP